jgi:large subunit ribosomal protein L22
MEAIAKLNDFPTAPRKARLVADLIRGKKVSQALGILTFQPQAAAPVVKKVLLSAVANWQQKNEGIDIDDANLYVKAAYVDGGRTLKRLRPAPQGRAYRIRKRSHHFTIVIDNMYSDVVSAEVEEINKTEEVAS